MLSYDIFAIKLPLAVGILILVSLTILGLRGKLAIVAGIYAATAYWITPPLVSDIVSRVVPLTWFLIPLLLFSWFIYIFRYKKPVNYTGIDRAFFLWVFLWVIWIIILLVIFNLSPDLQKTLFISVVFNLVMVLVPLTAISYQTRNIREFSISFLVMFVVEAVYAYYQITDASILQLFMAMEPVVFAGSLAINYHNFAKVASIAFIFCLTLVLDPEIRSTPSKFLIFGALLFSVFITIWSGARQYMLATAISGLLMILWASAANSKWRWLSLGVCVLVAIGSWFLYTNYRYQLRIEEQASITMRLSFYRTMWSWFTQSPIIGNGPYYGNSPSISHGLILDSLAAQGIVGFLFLCGFVSFIFYFSRGSWSFRGNPGDRVWRVGALSLFLLGLIQSQFSSNVLSAQVVYFGAALVWGLSPRTSISVAAENAREHLKLGLETRRLE